METWIFFALASALFAGIYSFSFKIIAERNYDIHLGNFYMYLTGFVVSFCLLVLLPGFEWSSQEFLLIAFLSFFMMLFYNASIHSRVESMKNVDAMIFYPLYKTLGPLFATAIGLFFFQESLTMKEGLGILCGISIPLLLITKVENRIQKNLSRGCIFIIFTSILAAISGSFQKYGVDLGLDVNMFLNLVFFFGMIFSGYGYFSKKGKKPISENIGILKLSTVSGLFFVGGAFCFMRALEGNFAIATTINSFSLLIPIILSIIFYGEHFNLKKGIVIALSIVSILLFI